MTDVDTTHMVVNCEAHATSVSPTRLLVSFLREDLGLTGTHVGCDTSQCGACTVLVDGDAVKSCTIMIGQIAGRAVTTIEGLDHDGRHPLQTAFRECHALQCGYCTPGMIMAATALLLRQPAPDQPDIVTALEGNLCRCTGYQPIIEAVKLAASAR